MTPRARSIAAGTLLLVAGAASGIAVDHVLVFRRHAAEMNASPSHTAAVHTALLAELDQVLHLTAAQHDTIDAILKRHQLSIDSAWRLIHMQLNAGMDSVHHELQGVLDPGQMTLLREWLTRQHLTAH